MNNFNSNLLNFGKKKGIVSLILFLTCIACNDNIIVQKEDIYTKDTEGIFTDYGEVLAFPGAEGYGQNASGGRGGEIYHVTNLDDDGEGSLRDAVSQPNRMIIFDVAGVINLKSALVINKKNLTIAGQTAPGDGIVLYGDRVSFSGAENLICRYLRIRMGINGPDGKDAAGVASGSNMIFDHMSITWGRDENFSINSSTANKITIQNSIIGQGLQNHSCGGLIQTNLEHGVTLYRNLYIDNKTRNPKVKGLNQFVNNVVYNWGDGAAYNMSGDSEGQSETSIVNNYLIVGKGDNWQNVRVDPTTGEVVSSGGEIIPKFMPIKPTKPFTGANERFRTYFVGNYYDSDKDGKLNGLELTTDNFETYCAGSPTFIPSPSEKHPEIKELLSAQEAYEWVVKYVGACLPARDEVDKFLIDELTSLGTKGTIIQDETDTRQFSLGGIGTIKSGEKPLDTDNDGIPDAFEDQHGLNKNDPSDASLIANNGYTNIENYIFSIDAQIQ